MLATAMPAVELLVFESTAGEEGADHSKYESINDCKNRPAFQPWQSVRTNQQGSKQRWVLEADLMSSLAVGQNILTLDFRGVVCPSHQELLCLQLQQLPVQRKYQSIVMVLLPPVLDSADEQIGAELASSKNLGERLFDIKLCTSMQRRLHFVQNK